MAFFKPSCAFWLKGNHLRKPKGELTLVFDNPILFEQAGQQLLPHLCHKLSLSSFGGDSAPESIAVECEDCGELLIDFVPESIATERPDPALVRYDGHYDPVRDVCYVEVLKPGKAPYPLQERQDIINHSPTSISWGYAGSGPAQCAFAILMDYFGDETKARTDYQGFKFQVIARLPMDSDWTLTGRQIERAIARIRQL